MKLFLPVLAMALLFSGSSYALGAVPTPIPEPSTLALMAGGIAVAAWIKFRKK